MIAGFFVDLANVVAEFAGVAAAMQIFGINKYVAVPIAAILVWILVIRGTYRQVEVIFCLPSSVSVLCIFRVLAKPDWLIAPSTRSFQIFSLIRVLDHADRLVGTRCALAVFYLQAGSSRKRLVPANTPQARADVLFGSVLA